MRNCHVGRTVLRAATGDSDLVYGGCRCGLPYYSVYMYYQKVTVTVDFFAPVTGPPAVQQRSHRQFLDGHRHDGDRL